MKAIVLAAGPGTRLGELGNFGQDVLPQAIRAGAAIVAHRLTRPVVDIGTSAGLARARALVG